MERIDRKITKSRLIDAGYFGLYRQAVQAVPLAGKAEIKVIAREGEEYTHTSVDLQLTGREEKYTGLVPTGKLYVELSSRQPIPSDFWDRYSKDPTR